MRRRLRPEDIDIPEVPDPVLFDKDTKAVLLIGVCFGIVGGVWALLFTILKWSLVTAWLLHGV